MRGNVRRSNNENMEEKNSHAQAFWKWSTKNVNRNVIESAAFKKQVIT